ncbi:MAG: putative metalloprotease CJM1_0395 family protein [Chitinispirillia bacterium]|jgi:hypothetical protein
MELYNNISHSFENIISSPYISQEEKPLNPPEKSPVDEETAGNQELTQEENQEVIELKNRDREVRAHEMAHLSAAGPYAQGGAQFEYKKGPDGKRYAVGGEVAIDTSGISNDPEATIQKMRIVRKAALAPSNPSAADRAIAAKASQKEAQARQELIKQKSENSSGNGKTENDKRNSLYSKDGLPIPQENSPNCRYFDLII